MNIMFKLELKNSFELFISSLEIFPIYPIVFILISSIAARVDRLEGHPDWYRRSPVEVEMEGSGSGSGSEGERIFAELYFNDDAGAGKNASLGTDLVLVESGDFRDFISS